MENLSPAIQASFENRVRLLEDAQHLLDYGRFPLRMHSPDDHSLPLTCAEGKRPDKDSRGDAVHA
jgi:hypothetical protein